MRELGRNTVATRPAPPASGTAGHAGPGDPAGTLPTIIGYEWYNAVTGALRFIIEATGRSLVQPGNADEDALLHDSVVDLIKQGGPGDYAFNAGFAGDGSGADLQVQPYHYLVAPRAVSVSGVVGYIEAPSSGAPVIVDIEKNGVSIFDTKPQFDAGANTMTAPVFSGSASSIAIAANDRIEFKVTQVGSTVAGQRVGVSLIAAA